MTTTSDHHLAVRTERRIGEVDTLRGFALFGILITNVRLAGQLGPRGVKLDMQLADFSLELRHRVGRPGP
jgi:uncharacterized membrane protein YeiB